MLCFFYEKRTQNCKKGINNNRCFSTLKIYTNYCLIEFMLSFASTFFCAISLLWTWFHYIYVKVIIKQIFTRLHTYIYKYNEIYFIKTQNMWKHKGVTFCLTSCFIWKASFGSLLETFVYKHVLNLQTLLNNM